MSTAEFDCRTCGACCTNLPSNVAEGAKLWVEIEEDDKILTRKDMLQKHVMYDTDGVPHLRMSADGRCLALQGTLGTKAHCRIYQVRPSPCRRVNPGDKLCLKYRKEHGMLNYEPNY